MALTINSVCAPHGYGTFLYRYSVHHLISISFCIWNDEIHHVYNDLFYFCGFNDTTTTSDCVTAKESKAYSFLFLSLSPSYSHSRILFFSCCFFPFISVTIVIIQYKSLHFNHFISVYNPEKVFFLLHLCSFFLLLTFSIFGVWVRFKQFKFSTRNAELVEKRNG